MPNDRKIAYFSMEIALDQSIPTYSGGLGVLAGDTLRSAADQHVPMVAITLLYRKGYLYQRLDSEGLQTEEPVSWAIEDHLQDVGSRISVTVEGRTVQVRAWRYEVCGHDGFAVPVYLLDTDLPENSEWDRTLSDCLYGGDLHYRLCQETVLGIGGVRMLRAAGHLEIERYHMNEGHAALLVLELLREHAQAEGRQLSAAADMKAVHQQCVFTTHTPVAAGHDKFPLDMADGVLGPIFDPFEREMLLHEGGLNMTYLALNLSHYVNGVAKKHGEVSREMFAGYQIDSITNGVHAATWTSHEFQDLFDGHIPGWREDNFSLRYALSIPNQEILQAHTAVKKRLIDYVNRETNMGMDSAVLTLGFARRATGYKRPDLLFQDIERLRRLTRKAGAIQVIYAGKAHPQDAAGKEIIQHIFRIKNLLGPEIKIAYLANYDMPLARLLTAGVDVWLNTPQRPMEASGTSGMKAAINGVPSLSILDGWWIEGCIEGVTGWAIGGDFRTGDPTAVQNDAEYLYQKLENTVIPTFYGDRQRFLTIMCHAIALNGSFFNTQRMMQQYVMKAYFE